MLALVLTVALVAISENWWRSSEALWVLLPAVLLPLVRRLSRRAARAGLDRYTGGALEEEDGGKGREERDGEREWDREEFRGQVRETERESGRERRIREGRAITKVETLLASEREWARAPANQPPNLTTDQTTLPTNYQTY